MSNDGRPPVPPIPDWLRRPAVPEEPLWMQQQRQAYVQSQQGYYGNGQQQYQPSPLPQQQPSFGPGQAGAQPAYPIMPPPPAPLSTADYTNGLILVNEYLRNGNYRAASIALGGLDRTVLTKPQREHVNRLRTQVTGHAHRREGYVAPPAPPPPPSGSRNTRR